ncbi:phage antirepressor KilAC domain-containing protein [Cetobacterium somerae]|uniref:phage antirepressor KilAC domain-containing protein n=1 Tax=Cetobacterium somerae TaxID=188913 RepID=UPI00211EAFE5|nr:phage antirepressor KilAC domain-containing protein [Cetobacterium somerae]MCQ9627559.1 phage antirepressor KilAC domain-containing protein [Cetobacterium somerae]
MELIKININEKMEQVVSGRELHERLDIKTKYKDWFPRMVEYGFVENIDFVAIAQKRATAQGNETTFIDHILTLEMAKQLCMLARNEKGMEFRKYFIRVETAWNDPSQIMARALQIANKTIDNCKVEIKQLENKIEEDKPKVLFAETIETARTSILVGELAKLIKQSGYDIGSNRLFSWLRENGYLIRRKGSDYNMPTQKSMELKLFEIKEGTRISGDGSIKITKTPKVSGKGQIYFINLFKKINKEVG